MEKFERADPNALADFDPRTKVCTMNCGPTVGDPRSPEERRFLCPDCVTVPVPSRNRANDLFSALLEFHNAFCNRDETTSLHVWNERMKSADENAVAVLNAAPHSSQPDTVAVPIDALVALRSRDVMTRVMIDKHGVSISGWHVPQPAFSQFVPPAIFNILEPYDDHGGSVKAALTRAIQRAAQEAK